MIVNALQGVSPARADDTTERAAQPYLVKAAHEFEAAMMKELLSPLESNEDDGAQGSTAALTSFAGEALGKALSERGGFGIATRILDQIAGRSNHSGKSAVPLVLKR
jgi:Rod binding domain-containing protein